MKNKRGEIMKLAQINEGLDNKFGIKIPKKKKFNSRDCLRMQSQLISSFIRGEPDSDHAKTLSYLLNSYLSNLQIVETEKRIIKLEEVINEKSN